MMPEEEIKIVKELLERLDPVIHRQLNKVFAKHGTNVGLSLVTNMATSFIALAVMIVERHDGDVDEFMSVLLHETKEKYDIAHATNKTQQILDKIMKVKPGSNTCRPMPKD